jgi:molybdopterin-binding protein
VPSTPRTVTLPSGDAVHATINQGACDALGLAEGVAATAVIKAPLVSLAFLSERAICTGI